MFRLLSARAAPLVAAAVALPAAQAARPSACEAAPAAPAAPAPPVIATATAGVHKDAVSRMGRVLPGDWARPDILRELISEGTVTRTIAQLGMEISEAYAGVEPGELCVVCLLNGAFMFTSDLVRELSVPHEVDFMCASSYGDGTVSTGNVKVRGACHRAHPCLPWRRHRTTPNLPPQIKKDMERSVKGRKVLIVDDICDSGTTLACLKKLMLARGATDVKSCVLISKMPRRAVDVDLEFAGLILEEDEFVVGYGAFWGLGLPLPPRPSRRSPAPTPGMDYASNYRSLPYVGVLRPEVYTKKE